MRFPEKKIRLKDGRGAILRSPAAEDAPALIDYLRTTAGETDFLLRTPEECNLSLQEEVQYIQHTLASATDLMICCFVDGVLAGNCNLRPHNKTKNKHRAGIGIALLKEFWGLGIGTIMFEEMIAIAQSWGLMQLELEVFEGNERAMGLYRKMGFETVSYIPNAIRLSDGTMLKEYTMVKRL